MSTNTFLLCEILDRLGSLDPFSSNSPLEFKFSGPKTSESLALENSLRNLVHRYEELELKVIEQSPETGSKAIIQQLPWNVIPQFTTLPSTPAPEQVAAEPRVPDVEPTESKSSSRQSGLISIDNNLVHESPIVRWPPTSIVESPWSDLSSDYAVVRAVARV